MFYFLYSDEVMKSPIYAKVHTSIENYPMHSPLSLTEKIVSRRMLNVKVQEMKATKTRFHKLPLDRGL